jgi:hypothetical protein
MINYKKGKIYMIVNDFNAVLYIGSTCQSLRKRMNAHRGASYIRDSKMYNDMRTHDDKSFEMMLICKCPTNTKQELLMEEYKMINSFLRSGIQLYNNQVNGKQSMITRQKMSNSHTGSFASAATKLKQSSAAKGKLKSVQHRANLSASKTNRGCIRFTKTTHSWQFLWYTSPGKQKTKSYSIRKWGDKAEQMALDLQTNMFPL